MNDHRNDRRAGAPAESQASGPAYRRGTDRGSPEPAAPGAPRVRVDLHCHSSASHLARRRTPPQASTGQALDRPPRRTLPECATSPREVYELAKRHGMDFVTITDHDTIAGVLELADEHDVFISEELTAWFKGEPQAVHVLCFGITPEDHEWLQAHSGNLEGCARYLHQHEIACALAHPFHNVAAPLTAAHRRILAELFPAWETRNGGGAREMNAAAATYIETHGGVAIGGSDDHAGIDIGRTYTEAPFAADSGELLEQIRAGRVVPHGAHGSAAQWAHRALALAARTLLRAGDWHPQREMIPQLAERILRDGDALASGLRRGAAPADVWSLLTAWLEEMDPSADPAGLLAIMQSPDFEHADLERRARRVHERKLKTATRQLINRDPAACLGRSQDADITSLLRACLPALPYIPATAALAGSRLAAREEEPTRVAIVADGVGGPQAAGHPLLQLRERGLPGHELDLIGTDPNADRRLPAVADLEHPPGAEPGLGVPSLFAVAEAFTERRYDLLHLCAPSPAALAALAVARVIGIPAAASFSPAAQARPTRIDPTENDRPLPEFYAHCQLVLSPGPLADAALGQLGIDRGKLGRWEPGVDLERFHPGRYSPDALPSGSFNLLHVGPLGVEHGTELLAEAFLLARDREPRLHLVLAGHGPADPKLTSRFANAATFLGAIDGDRLAQIYASADLLVFVSPSDGFGLRILEAQASGLAVLAIDADCPAERIESGRSGCLAPPEPQALASAIRGLARRAAVRDRLATGGLLSVRRHGLERSLEQLARAWRAAIDQREAPRGVPRAA